MLCLPCYTFSWKPFGRWDETFNGNSRLYGRSQNMETQSNTTDRPICKRLRTRSIGVGLYYPSLKHWWIWLNKTAFLLNGYFGFVDLWNKKAVNPNSHLFYQTQENDPVTGGLDPMNTLYRHLELLLCVMKRDGRRPLGRRLGARRARLHSPPNNTEAPDARRFRAKRIIKHRFTPKVGIIKTQTYRVS